MKKYNYSLLCLLFIVLFTACKEDDDAKGSPQLTNPIHTASAYFGDSISFSADITDNIPLSTLKAQLFFGEEMVSETVIRTKTNGHYAGKLFVPVFAYVPDGKATLRLAVQNIEFGITEYKQELPLSRRQYPYLNLVMEDGTVEQMPRVGENEYKLTDNFDQKFKAVIRTPKIEAGDNEVTFGWEDSKIKASVESNIPFSNYNSGTYDVTFNTFTFEASPFIKLMFGDQEMAMVDDNNYKIEKTFTQGESNVIEGIPNLDEWWIDSDFLQKESGNKLKFLPLGGKYRLTANFELKYFVVEHMNGTKLSALDTDGNAMWLIGSGVGKPTASNNIGWDTNKGLCMAKIGDKKFQITIPVIPVTYNSTNTELSNKYDFKFFYQKGWGGEFKAVDYESYQSDMITITEGGNFLPEFGGVILNPAKYYVITIDVSKGNNKAVMTLTQK